MSSFKIQFSGQILSGYAIEQTQSAFCQLFKVSPEIAQQVFSGQTKTLKRNLTHEQALRYLERLRLIGMDVQLKAEREAPQPTEAAPQPIQAAAPITVIAPVEPEPSPYAPSQAQFSHSAVALTPMTETPEDTEPAPRFWVWSFWGSNAAGRLSSIRFTGYFCLLLMIQMLAMYMLRPLPKTLGNLIIVLAFLPPMIRLLTLRLHDLNLPGLFQVPYFIAIALYTARLGALSTLANYAVLLMLLLFLGLPGSPTSNDYGTPNEPPGWTWLEPESRLDRGRYFAYSTTPITLVLLSAVITMVLGYSVIRSGFTLLGLAVAIGFVQIIIIFFSLSLNILVLRIRDLTGGAAMLVIAGTIVLPILSVTMGNSILLGYVLFLLVPLLPGSNADENSYGAACEPSMSPVIAIGLCNIVLCCLGSFLVYRLSHQLLLSLMDSVNLAPILR